MGDLGARNQSPVVQLAPICLGGVAIVRKMGQEWKALASVFTRMKHAETLVTQATICSKLIYAAVDSAVFNLSKRQYQSNNFDQSQQDQSESLTITCNLLKARGNHAYKVIVGFVVFKYINANRKTSGSFYRYLLIFFCLQSMILTVMTRLVHTCFCHLVRFENSFFPRFS